MSNKNYMCILRSQSGGCEKPSPSEMELMYAKYQEWQNKFADNIVDIKNKGSGLTFDIFIILFYLFYRPTHGSIAHIKILSDLRKKGVEKRGNLNWSV